MRTDHSKAGVGFAASFKSSNNCSYVYRQEAGLITSPDYPDYYDPYTNCSWLIDVKKGPATLQFTGINMFNSSECMTDSVEVFDGNSTASPLLQRLCKMGKPMALNGSSQFLFIRMRTGSISYGTGFRALYYNSNNDCPSLASNEFYTEYLSWNGNCYGLTKSEYRWQEGRDTCERLGTSLLYIESTNELNALTGWISQSFYFIPSIWTGAFRRRAGSPSWFWSTNTGDVVMNDGISKILTGEDTLQTYSVFLMDNTLYLVSNPYSFYQVICKVRSHKNMLSDSPKMPCAAPINIHSGYYTPTKATFLSGSLAKYNCANGYEMSGNATVACENGFWIGAFPSCLLKPDPEDIKLRCSPPPTTQYTLYKPMLPSYDNGVSLSFSCHWKYLLTSNSSITCLNGIWQGIQPSCIEATQTSADSTKNAEIERPESARCYQPKIEHASFFPSSKTYTNGSEVLVLCILEDKRSVSGNLICVNGVWSGKPLTCYERKAENSQNVSKQISKPEPYTSQGVHGNNSVVVPATVILIAVLVAVIVGGGIYFVIYRRRENPLRPLVEME